MPAWQVLWKCQTKQNYCCLLRHVPRRGCGWLLKSLFSVTDLDSTVLPPLIPYPSPLFPVTHKRRVSFSLFKKVCSLFLLDIENTAFIISFPSCPVPFGRVISLEGYTWSSTSSSTHMAAQGSMAQVGILGLLTGEHFLTSATFLAEN